MAVKTFQPQATVTVYKRIERRSDASARVGQASRRINLAPFLTEGGTIQTFKDIRSPAGGFTISLTDEADRSLGGSLDSLAGFLEPMDYVEISLAREGAPRIVMRGFLSNIRRFETLSGGKPTRRVILSGQDYGKVPQMVAIIMRRDLANENFGAYLSAFPLLVKFGFGNTAIPADQWMSLTVNGVLNSFLSRLRGFVAYRGEGVGPIPNLGFEPGGVPGQVGGLGIQFFDGTMASFIAQNADLPWNEAFIEDRDSGPFMVYRPIPWVALSGAPIQTRNVPRNLMPDGSRMVIKADEILTMSTQRSDQDVANIFFVNAPIAELAAQTPLANEALLSGSNFVQGNPNCSPELYGDRIMEASTSHVSPQIFGQLSGKPAGAAKPDSIINSAWFANRRDLLKALYQDNVVFESGAITVRGNDRIKPGRYIDVQRGNRAAQVYVTGVTHSFEPFRSFTTSIQFERGTGFLERTRASESQYLSETGIGVYE